MPLSLRLSTIISMPAWRISASCAKSIGRVVAVVDRRIAVFERHRMLGVGAVDFDRAHALLVLLDGPSGDIDVMGAPVGELAARVFIPPAELRSGSAAECSRPSAPGRARSSNPAPSAAWSFETLPPRSPPLMPTVMCLMSPSNPFCTMLTARRKRSRSLRCWVPTKKTCLSYFLRGVADQLIFFERQRERLLRKHMLAGLERLDARFSHANGRA